MTRNMDNVGLLATGSGMEQFQLSLGGWFVPGTRSSMASGAYPLSGSGSGPADLQKSLSSTQLSHPGDASAGGRVESTLLVDWVDFGLTRAAWQHALPKGKRGTIPRVLTTL